MKKVLTLILAAMMLAGTVVTVAADGSPFSDVKTSRWSYKSIIYAVEKELMNGVGGGKFDPAGVMTRGMVVTVLYRMQNSPEVEFTNDFTDVKAGKYYSDAVIWAKNNGIVNGVDQGKFDPGGKITREQLATMLFRYAEFCDLDTRVKGTLSSFPDESKTHSYAKDALIWATSKGLITGVKSGDKDLLDPRGNATREQFATILMRYCEADLSRPLEYNTPVAISQYTEPEYPLVENADLYVATDGDDSNPGTFDAPLATFEGAKARVREILADGSRPAGEIVVAFKAGVYKAPENITFTAEDSGTEESPVVYCKYGDGEVEFNAGARIPLSGFTELTAEEKEMFPETSREKVRKADLASYGVDVAALGEENNVFAGRERLDSARWPNKYENGHDAFTDMIMSLNEDETGMYLMSVLVRKLNKYHNIDEMRMFGYYKYDWAASDGKVISYDPETGLIKPTVNGYGIHIFQYEGAPKPYFYFYNIPDELDREDEFYIDVKTGTLYVMNPKEDYTIGQTGLVMTINGADHLTFRGLSFAYGTDNAVNAPAANYITFDRCYFHNFYRYGIDIRGNNITIYGTEFYDIGYRAVDLRSGDRETLTFGNSVVENCLFDRFGSIGKTMMPAVYVGGCGNRVAHNEMCNSSNSAVVYSEYIWASNYITVEYNYIHDVVTQSSDYGAIYAGRNPAGHGSVVRYNLLCNVGCPEEGHNPLGVYLDDGEAGQEIYGNIFYNMANHCVFTNGGRENKIHDNIMISTVTKDKLEIWIGGEVGLNDEGVAELDPEWVMITELVPIRSELWSSRFPTLAMLNYDEGRGQDALDDPYFLRNPSFNEIYNNALIIHSDRIERGGYEALSEAATRFAGRYDPSAVYSLEENPFFVDPTRGDYRLRDDADFFDIPVEEIGKY